LKKALLPLLLALPASAANVGVRLPASLPALPAAAVPSAVSLPSQLGALPASPATLSAPLTPRDAVAGNSISPIPSAPAAFVGAAIAEAPSVDAAFAKLVADGGLKAEAVPQDPTDKLYALKRLWDHAAPAYAEGKIAVDASWAVPALRVENGGTTFLIHPVAHGQLYPPNKRPVGRLVKQIEKAGEALYSEQYLPSHYAFSYGRETADHGVDEGAPISVGPAARGVPAGALKAFHAAVVAAALTPLALAAPQILHNPALATILPAVLYAAFLAVVRSGLLPFYRWGQEQRAREARTLGAEELAAQLSREAAALHKATLDPLEVLRLHLPPGPGAESDPFAARSAAMAKAVAEDAAAAGAKVVHLLVGYKHAADIGWRLRSQLP
jgi:hypothetical protein